MKGIQIYHSISMERSTLLAAWPGMGNVALGAIDYLRRKLETMIFAEMDMSQLSAPDAVEVEDGLARLAKSPKSLFYHKEELSLVIFESETQVSGTAGIRLMDRILGLAKELGVQRIYTGAAFPLPMSYEEPSTVFGVANKESLRDYLSGFGVRIMEGGQISGLNGLLLAYAARKGIEAACLLATLPLYAVSFPNPKASKAIVETLMRMLDIKVDTMEIELEIGKMDEKMAVVEEKIKDVFPVVDKEDKVAELEQGKVPDYVLRKIENLFHEAKLDKQKAYALKEELDRWNLYEMYEDRFLDLFRKEH